MGSYKDKSAKWLAKSIKECYKVIFSLQRRYHDSSQVELEEFDFVMHKLVDQVKKMEYELADRRGIL